jgi:hypothetical protein
MDVVAVLTYSPEPRKYWSVLKTRLKKEGVELTTIQKLQKIEKRKSSGQYDKH